MTLIRRYALPFLLAILFAGPSLLGCAGLPMQQMSDARQAIRAAERAGAERHAPALLGEARQLVEQARQNVHRGEYRLARDDAEMARARAMEARRIAEAAGTAAQP